MVLKRKNASLKALPRNFFVDPLFKESSMHSSEFFGSGDLIHSRSSNEKKVRNEFGRQDLQIKEIDARRKVKRNCWADPHSQVALVISRDPLIVGLETNIFREHLCT